MHYTLIIHFKCSIKTNDFNYYYCDLIECPGVYPNERTLTLSTELKCALPEVVFNFLWQRLFLWLLYNKKQAVRIS